MTDTESLRHVAQSRAPLSAWLGVMLLFAVFGAIVLAVVGPSSRRDHYEETRAKKRADVLKTVREAEKSLSSYSWLDKNAGTVKIPIDRAMQITGDELRNKKPAMAGPIAPAAPAASTAQPAGPAGAATPAPPSAKPGPSGTPKPIAIEGPHSENRAQPAAVNNPPNAPPGTQPGTNATPAAGPGAPSGRQPVPTASPSHP